MNKENWTEKLIAPLYQEGYLQTLWNTQKEKNHREGWWLKNGMWSPYFFNMRPVGDSPDTFNDICQAMKDLTTEYYQDIDLLIGIEMAGVSLVGGLSAKARDTCKDFYYFSWRIGYTRPLPIKPRNPIGALEIIRLIDAGMLGGEKTKLNKALELIDFYKDGEIWKEKSFSNLKDAVDILRTFVLGDGEDYGQKEFVEARFQWGDRVGIVDDMATDLGSKIIARAIVLWQAKKMDIPITCNKIFYLLNRNKGNFQKGLDFANETDSRLYPEPLDVNYVIEFDDALPYLKGIMGDAEYGLISAYQKDPEQFQDEGTKKEALAMAARY